MPSFGIGNAIGYSQYGRDVTDDDGMTTCELPNDIDTLEQLVIDTHQQVIDRDEQITQHTERITQRDKQIAQHTQQLTERDEWLAERESQIMDRESQIAYLKHKLFGRRGEEMDPRQLWICGSCCCSTN